MSPASPARFLSIRAFAGGSAKAAQACAQPTPQEVIDQRMMMRCIELSKTAPRDGEYPFACVIGRGEEVVVETTNRVARDADITHHAELVAVSQAYRMRDSVKLKECTLYTNVEPCPMCSFAIRESGIGRVVFALKSPLMGGYSRWDILQCSRLSTRMPEVFGSTPEVVAGCQAKEAARAWRRWNPIVWGVIRLRGIFGHR